MPCQVAQQSVSKWTQGMQPTKLDFRSNSSAPKPVKEVDQVTLTAGRSLEQEMEAWRRNSRWVDETPALEVHHLHSIDNLMLGAAPVLYVARYLSKDC
jgi:hypothetical protein